MACPRCGGGSGGSDKRVFRKSATHTEVYTPPSPTIDNRYPGGTFESRHVETPTGKIFAKTTIVKDATGNIFDVKRGKNSKSGPARGHLGFLSGLFTFLGNR